MQDFIKTRLNKDNFWNLMFFFLMFSGVSTAFAANVMILSWITIIGVVWLVKRNSNIVFNKEKSEFIISGNKQIKASGAEFILLMFFSFGIMALVGFILDKLKIDDSPLLLAGMMSLLILVPTIYCILRNLPIAVYFKKEAWAGNDTDDAYSSDDDYLGINSNHFSASSDSKLTSMSYDYLPGNIYHSSYLDRYRK